MSVFTYIASDFPLKEVENSHVKQLSVNQALEMKIEIPDFLLEPSFDKDEPGVMLWVDNDKNFGEISIRAFNKNDMCDDIYTDKKFTAYLEWDYTENRAKSLIHYIYDHLLDACEIQLWNIWLGEWFNDPTPKIKTRHIQQLDDWFDGFKPKIKMHHIDIDQLTCSDLKKVFNRKNIEYPECIVVTQAKSTNPHMDKHTQL